MPSIYDIRLREEQPLIIFLLFILYLTAVNVRQLLRHSGMAFCLINVQQAYGYFLATAA
jgi:hypothetical protein